MDATEYVHCAKILLDGKISEHLIGPDRCAVMASLLHAEAMKTNTENGTHQIGNEEKYFFSVGEISVRKHEMIPNP